MQSRAFEVFPFFSHVKKHVGLHESDHVGKDTGKRYYVDRFLSLFYHVFFETVADSPERYEIWESHFPKEWQITVDRLKTSKLSEISLKAYLNWASPRIRDPEVQFDKNLDDVTMNIFPESEPMAWAMVLMFAYTSWGTSRVEAMIARPWNFGRVGRPVFYSGTIEEDESQRDQARLVRLEETRRQQLTETFELAQRFFPESFSKTSLEQFVGELQQLNYEDGTQEERKRVSLLEFFQEMLEFLNSSRTQSSGVSET